MLRKTARPFVEVQIVLVKLASAKHVLAALQNPVIALAVVRATALALVAKHWDSRPFGGGYYF